MMLNNLKYMRLFQKSVDLSENSVISVSVLNFFLHRGHREARSDTEGIQS